MMDWNNGLGWHNNMGWGGWFGMGIFMFLFWGLIIWGIVALVRYVNASGQKASFHARAHEAATSPDQILGERFARSEIDEEEYSRRLAVLRSPHETNVCLQGQRPPEPPVRSDTPGGIS